MDSERHVLIGLVGLVLLTGCLGGLSDGELSGDMSEAEFESFIESRDSAAAQLETYSIDVNLNARTDRTTVGMGVEGDVNRTARQARLEYDLQQPRSGPFGPPPEFVAYFNESHMFVETDTLEWDRIALDDLEDDNMEQIWTIDEHGTTAEMLRYGDVHVDVRDDVVVVTTKLSGREMNTIMDGDAAFTTVELDDGTSFEEFTITETVDAETHHLRSVEQSGTVSQGGESASVHGRIVISNHNGNVSAEIPDEVYDYAVDAPATHPFL